jgi:hypothetical protein
MEIHVHWPGRIEVSVMWLTASRKAARFKLGREPQSDEAFVEGCGYQADSSQAAVALTVRRVIGECGAVEHDYIHAGDRWPEELGCLDFWDSIDFLHFAFSLEKAIGSKLTLDGELRSYFCSGFVVSKLVNGVVARLESRNH